MNPKLIQKYLVEYKKQFSEISQKEIYKWEAIKQFQDNWNEDSDDFAGMLERCFLQSKNLLASGAYFPLKMLLQNARETPDRVKGLLLDLFDEDIDLLKRIEFFREGFNKLSTRSFSEKHKTYQDDRAIIVYLALRFPEDHFLYKYGIFRDAAKKTRYTYVPRKGNLKNIYPYYRFCEIIKYYTSLDQELVNLHNQRLTSSCYIDNSLHVLTQDIIYAIANYLNIEGVDHEISVGSVQKGAGQGMNKEGRGHKKDNFTPHIVDYERLTKRNKHIGNMGELWVVQYEKQKLINMGKPKLAEKVLNIAQEYGDGAGYDVLSFDIAGNKILIEVKTTTSGGSTPFYITERELKRSKRDKNYYLYRVFEFDEERSFARVHILQGDLEQLKIHPTMYKAII